MPPPKGWPKSFTRSAVSARRSPRLGAPHECQPGRRLRTPRDGPTRTFTFTMGKTATQTTWDQHWTGAWPEVVSLLTSHTFGPKEGPCIVPAQLRGTRRHKLDTAQIDAALLDFDFGMPLGEIEAALKARGWEAVISSTHSHMATQTNAKRSHWDRFFTENPTATAADFLQHEKHFVAAVASGATPIESGGDYIIIQHRPCPKFQIVVPLADPWRASRYPSQTEANAAWKERVEALAAALHLDHNQSCTDTSRLFYLPRTPPNGAAPETAVIDGRCCDIFSLPAASAHADLLNGAGQQTKTKQRKRDDDRPEFVDPITAKVIDLASWARGYGARFLIAKALRERKPRAFTGFVADGAKVHIDCPNGSAHTDPRRDNATYVVNAGQSATKGFVIHCRHGHCTDLYRVFMVKRMLEQGWLTPDDLTDDRFLLPVELANGEWNKLHEATPEEKPEPSTGNTKDYDRVGATGRSKQRGNPKIQRSPGRGPFQSTSSRNLVGLPGPGCGSPSRTAGRIHRRHGRTYGGRSGSHRPLLSCCLCVGCC